MKIMKKERRITLVALIITVIILIILAAISITALTKGNFIGLATKASQNYAEAQEYEGKIMENYTSLLDAVVGNITGNTPPPKEEEGEKLTLAPNTADNYGKYVDIGVDVVGTTETTDDWMIFYETTDRIYLIATDCVPYEKLPEEVTSATKLVPYNKDAENYPNTACWFEGTQEYTGNYITDELEKEFMLEEYDIAEHAGSSGIGNSQSVADLLNTEAWGHMLDNSTKKLN